MSHRVDRITCPRCEADLGDLGIVRYADWDANVWACLCGWHGVFGGPASMLDADTFRRETEDTVRRMLEQFRCPHRNRDGFALFRHVDTITRTADDGNVLATRRYRCSGCGLVVDSKPSVLYKLIDLEMHAITQEQSNGPAS